MNCTECLDLINPYLDGELEEQLQAEVESHLVSCSGCSDEAAVWQTELMERFIREDVEWGLHGDE
jgi:anti-sigma factor RsiW